VPALVDPLLILEKHFVLLSDTRLILVHQQEVPILLQRRHRRRALVHRCCRRTGAWPTSFTRTDEGWRTLRSSCSSWKSRGIRHPPVIDDSVAVLAPACLPQQV
jgi:hypothetical protein